MSIKLSIDWILIVDWKLLKTGWDELFTAYQLAKILTSNQTIPLEHWLAIQGKVINTELEVGLSMEDLIRLYLAPAIDFFDQQSLLEEFYK